MGNEKKNEVAIVQEAITSKKLVTEKPIRTASIEIPIIPPREHVDEEVTVKTVRVRKPVQIDFINISMADGGGYKITMPGGEVSFFGASQEVLVGSMEELLKLIAQCLGQTTYEYVEMTDFEWEKMKKEGHLY